MRRVSFVFDLWSLEMHDSQCAKEQVTYVAGEWSTFDKAIITIESFYGISTISPIPISAGL